MKYITNIIINDKTGNKLKLNSPRPGPAGGAGQEKEDAAATAR
jgi:hypothetical protein